MVKHLLIMGPQGSGKGTQAAKLGEEFDIQPISTGDIFRYNISKNTPLGEKVQAIIAKGELVSDELTGELVRDALSLDNAKEGFILDGYPRNINQLVDLDSILDEFSLELDAVIVLTADRDELITRMAKRAKAQGRADDTPEVIAQRLAIYDTETAPLIERYQKRGKAVIIDAVGPIEEVTERIVKGILALKS